ncbi:GntR family transcriptional regulator [Paractinoplanes deccanensis]|uniref:GntR family transcriptional regulator n=1 Tax=Paractinoplanes deccanensis TaxID=113561 RepID=UPI001EF26A42|nr:winged helix-turn-helix domain-containing protein [Actinoplanes deccanensis]
MRDGRLNPNDPLPSARKMADVYGVASMTAQRALRELQNRRITYAVAGKGTFVHPDAFDLLRSGVLQEPIDDPDSDAGSPPTSPTSRPSPSATTRPAPSTTRTPPCKTCSTTPTPTAASSTK